MVKKIRVKKKRTQAQTPAPKKDQITGSKKNPKGSASGARGGIEISDSAVKTLEGYRDEHNEKYSAKSKKVDLGTLKQSLGVELVLSLLPIGHKSLQELNGPWLE